MSKRLSQEEATKRSKDVGIELIGRYIGSNNKTLFKCPKCHKEFITRPEDVWSGNTKRCNRCREPHTLSQNMAENSNR